MTEGVAADLASQVAIIVQRTNKINFGPEISSIRVASTNNVG